MDLAIGGESWVGAQFKKWSNAKEWRIFLPNGKHFLVLSAEEIKDNWIKAQEHKRLRGEIIHLEKQIDGELRKNYEYVLAENKRLKELVDIRVPHFTEDESRKILGAVAILSREVLMPRRRSQPVQVMEFPPRLPRITRKQYVYSGQAGGCMGLTSRHVRFPRRTVQVGLYSSIPYCHISSNHFRQITNMVKPASH